MKVNLITNVQSPGLYQDICILRRLLESMPDTHVRVIDNFSASIDTFASGADLSIFLESLNNANHYLQCAHSNWLIVNPEYYFPDQFDRYLSLISLVICKTQHAYQVWAGRVGRNRCLYTGFESRDMLVDGIQKSDGFIHVVGKSMEKGTDMVAEAWRSLSYQLTVVTRAQTQAEGHVTWGLANRFAGNPAVRHLHNLSDDHLAQELSQHRFVIQPSLYEGYGHVIHEAFSAKCVVLTTDAPPMNESAAIDRRMLIPVSRRVPRMMVEFNYCSAHGIRTVVESAVKMSARDLTAIGEGAREEWIVARAIFRETFMIAIERWEEWI